ncbi:MAG: polysaccharide export protein [Deltaproteobacteria bacterium]|nr:MAG: polysaccharide export protein [Deltaproteobacteria bacterium]
MSRWAGEIFSVLLASLLACCLFERTPQTPEVPVSKVRTAESTLGPGDVFEVKVYDEKDLSGVFRVSATGTIKFPLIGTVSVEGLTSTEAADLIQQKLAEKYIKNPQVSILVKEYNSKKVSVFGQVNKPGTFPYEEGMTVIQAISMAGGFTKMAAKNDTNVTRIVGGEERKFPVPVEAIAEGKAKNFYLKPGDIVYVPESIW